MMSLSRLDTTSTQQSAAATRATAIVATPNTTANTSTVSESARIKEAARDFETVFLRQMLSALERTTKIGTKGPSVPGQQAYGSMIVEAVADAVAQAGGIGLASVLAKALAERSSVQLSSPTAQGQAIGPNQPATVHKLDRSGAQPGAVADLVKISPQGLSSYAVPRIEIRTSAAQITGHLADRRIR